MSWFSSAKNQHSGGPVDCCESYGIGVGLTLTLVRLWFVFHSPNRCQTALDDRFPSFRSFLEQGCMNLGEG
jgi:hypothetical protein